MDWEKILIVASVSLALASLFKYGFSYLTGRSTDKIFKEAVATIVNRHGDMIIEILKQEMRLEVINHINRKLGDYGGENKKSN